MPEKKYLSAKVDPDSALYEQFMTVKEEDGYESNSEAVRALIRDALDARNEPDTPDTPRWPTDTEDQNNAGSDLIRGNEPILAGLAFIIASDGFLTAMQAVVGELLGTMLFAAFGITILLSLSPMVYRSLGAYLGSGTADNEQTADGEAA